MRTMVVIVPYLTGRGLYKCMPVSLPLVECLLGDGKYRLSTEPEPPVNVVPHENPRPAEARR